MFESDEEHPTAVDRAEKAVFLQAKVQQENHASADQLRDGGNALEVIADDVAQHTVDLERHNRMSRLADQGSPGMQIASPPPPAHVFFKDK